MFVLLVDAISLLIWTYLLSLEGSTFFFILFLVAMVGAQLNHHVEIVISHNAHGLGLSLKHFSQGAFIFQWDDPPTFMYWRLEKCYCCMSPSYLLRIDKSL